MRGEGGRRTFINITDTSTTSTTTSPTHPRHQQMRITVQSSRRLETGKDYLAPDHSFRFWRLICDPRRAPVAIISDSMSVENLPNQSSAFEVFAALPPELRHEIWKHTFSVFAEFVEFLV